MEAPGHWNGSCAHDLFHTCPRVTICSVHANPSAKERSRNQRLLHEAHAVAIYAHFLQYVCPLYAIRIAYRTIIIVVQALIDFAFAIIAVKTLLKLKLRLSEKFGLTIAMSLGLL